MGVHHVRSALTRVCAGLVFAACCCLSLSAFAQAQPQYNYSDNRLKMSPTGTPGEFRVDRVDPSQSGASKSVNAVSVAANDPIYKSTIKIAIEGKEIDINLKQGISNALIGRFLTRLVAYFNPVLGWATAGVEILKTLYDIYKKENNDLALSPAVNVKYHQRKIKNVSYVYVECTSPVRSEEGFTGDCNESRFEVWSDVQILAKAKALGCRTGYVIATGYVIDCQVIRLGYSSAYVYGYWPGEGITVNLPYERCYGAMSCAYPNGGYLDEWTHVFSFFSFSNSNLDGETWDTTQSKAYDTAPLTKEDIQKLPPAPETAITKRIEERTPGVSPADLEVTAAVVNDALKYGSDTRIKIDFDPAAEPLTYGATDLDLGTSTIYEVDALGKVKPVRVTKTAALTYRGQYVNIKLLTERVVDGVKTSTVSYPNQTAVVPKVEEKPNLVDCDKYPNVTGCSQFGTADEQKIKDKSKVFSLLRTSFSSNATCPPPPLTSITLLGWTVPAGFNYQPACAFAGNVRGVVLLLATVLSAYIFVGMFKL